MKILVTGYRGYIGSHLVWYLRQHMPNASIHGIDCASKFDRLGSFGICSLLNDNTVPLYWTTDFWKDQEPYDVIFHLAAESNISVFNEKPIKAVQSTIDIMSVLEIPHEKFVFASSAAVFPKSSLYGRTKFLCEQMVANKSENYTTLRLHNVAGAIPESGFYEYHQPETHLIPNLILNDTITIFGDGDQIRDYVHVKSVCEAFFKVAFRKLPDKKYVVQPYFKNSILEIGTSKGYSVIDVVRAYQEVSGKTINIHFGELREGDVKELVASHAFVETPTLRETIKDTITAYEKAGLLTI